MQYSISNYPNYLTVSPSSAQIAAKGKQSVSVKVNRDLLEGESSTQLTVNIGNDSYTVSININSSDLTSKISVSPTTLNFGEAYNELQFTVRNIGTSGDLKWNIPTPTNKCLRVYPSTGITSIGSSTQVTVTLDRSMMDADITSAFINVATDGGSIPVTVTATKAGSGSGSEGGNTGDIAVKSGLFVYYKFDDNFDDSSENEVNGFGTNNPTFTEGVSVGKAIKFNRMDDSKFTVSYPIIDSKEMTISFWGKIFSDGHIFHMLSSINSEPMFTLTMSGGALKFIVTRYNNWYQYDNTNTFIHPTLNDGKWHHIVLTSDFNKRKFSTITTDLYIDGKKVYTLTEDANYYSENGGSQSSYGTGTVFTMGGELKIGTRTINGTNMCIDNFRVYDTRMLSENEIKEIFNVKQ